MGRRVDYLTVGGWRQMKRWKCKEFDNRAKPDCLREATLLYDILGWIMDGGNAGGFESPFYDE
jgi:hypothetical protein